MSAKKVLILENDIFLVTVMQKRFQKNGHKVRVLLNGIKAVETALSFNPDVILVDLVMPEKDGFLTINNLKKHPKTATVPIVVASNLDSRASIAKAKKLGCVNYFVKSNVELNEVIEYIGNL